jgi:hypothetical protein
MNARPLRSEPYPRGHCNNYIDGVQLEKVMFWIAREIRIAEIRKEFRVGQTELGLTTLGSICSRRDIPFNGFHAA